MPQVRVHNFSVSPDGFGTGEGQSLDAPFGHAGVRLHEWFFATRTFHAMQGQPGGSTGIDDAFASASEPGIGAEIMGRGKFGPHHGPWPDQEWNGWWGDNPPFRTPVFILTLPTAYLTGLPDLRTPSSSHRETKTGTCLLTQRGHTAPRAMGPHTGARRGRGRNTNAGR